MLSQWSCRYLFTGTCSGSEEFYIENKDRTVSNATLDADQFKHRCEKSLGLLDPVDNLGSHVLGFKLTMLTSAPSPSVGHTTKANLAE